MMTERPLAGRRVAVLSTSGFERVELAAVRDALLDAGAEARVVAPKGPAIRAFEFPEWADEVPVDLTLDEAQPDGFDALYVPGGIINPGLLRADARAVSFARAFLKAGRPAASMCHGPWVLTSAGGVRGRRAAAWPTPKDDLENAGAVYVGDAPVAEDGNLVTARHPGDTPELNRALLRRFARGGGAGRAAA